MGVDFASLLARKYAIMQQQADADTSRAAAGGLSAQASANLDTVRAGLLPRESAANVAQTAAQTAGIREQNRFIDPLARSTIGLQSSQARQNAAQAGYLGSETTGNDILNRDPGGFLSLLQKIRAQQAGQSPLGL